MPEQMARYGQYGREHDGHDGDAQKRVRNDLLEQVEQEATPSCRVDDRLYLGRILKCLAQALRQARLQKAVSRFGQLNHIRCEEGGNHAYRHNNGIKVSVGHLEALAQRGNDEGELTDLCHAETALHGHFERLTGE